MPLDDVYIHFQYARQMAAGQPYIYNPGLPATSGATSFLYPYVLAIGYLIGFQGLKLGLWAMSVGAAALVCAMWLVYKLVRLLGTGDWLAVLVAVAFGVSGPVAWHFMSGMETGWVMLFTLGTAYSVIQIVGDDGANQKAVVAFIAWATALALIRPEGGVLAVVAVGALGWQKWGFASGKPLQSKPYLRWARMGLIIPVLAVGVQPLVNWLLTGSAVASGNAAKSILGTVPFYWDDVIRRILSNFVQMWVEFGTGISPREGLYIMPLLLIFALVGIGFLLINRRLRTVGVMLVLWLLAGTAMLATLDTVFWHFKRYQMPFIALLFPLAGWGIGVVASYKWQRIEPPSRQEHQDFSPQRRRDWRSGAEYLVIGVMLVVAAFTSVQFWRYYGLNVGYVYAQPLQMARWLQANTPDNAVIAVHDVGMMRYMGGRTTLDIVGLTTKGAADYWRNGPGAVAEFLMKEKPDYIASYGYGHGYGLGMIADTDIYGKPLVSFPVDLDNNANVALAANSQGIYKLDWKTIAQSFVPLQSTSLQYLKSFSSQQVMDRINVADIESEQTHLYHWQNVEGSAGFATVVRQMDYIDCLNNPCSVVDAGRTIDGDEIFQILPNGISDDNDVLLITRIHPSAEGSIDIYVRNKAQQNETLIATKVIPATPGQWLEIPTLIPSKYLTRNQPLWIHVIPHVTNGFYEPYNHAIVVGKYQPEKLAAAPISTFQDGAIQLGVLVEAELGVLVID
ncbi:MAG: hypothetical protein ABI970_16345, partial [Chloroflexota bacterium]